MLILTPLGCGSAEAETSGAERRRVGIDQSYYLNSTSRLRSASMPMEIVKRSARLRLSGITYLFSQLCSSQFRSSPPQWSRSLSPYLVYLPSRNRSHVCRLFL
ncbi:hypothetical protein B5X24_HaOG206959 [Helicoverpa armigera]|nr:hypothetical protein B5X24_HaOG206959 [Helicoverpa armigera]